jgi:AraC-like DNA-binding protein
MLFEFSFYSSLLLIFFVHGFVYAILLWRKSVLNETASDKWLAIFLFLAILYIAPWMLGFAGWYDTQPYRDVLFYVPFLQLFFIGPVIFFYVQSLLNPSFRFSKKEIWHLIPGILYLLYSIVIVVTDKLVLHQYFFLADGADRDFDDWYQLSGYVSMIVYFIASIRFYYLYKKLLVQVMSNADTVLFKWIRNFLIAFLAILIVRFILFILSFSFNLRYWDTWWYFFAFSIAFYYIAVTGYANSIKTKMPFVTDLFTTKPALLLQYPAINNNIEEAEVVEIDNTDSTAQDNDFVNEWKEKILHAVVTEKLYEDTELSLTQMARQLNTNPSVLSKIINQGFQQNFNDFVNQYRVDAVKEKLKAGEQKIQTLLGIAYDCGFNSKATFNRAFKKTTGLSPKEWQEKVGSNEMDKKEI